jgi:hypothetical protein
MGDAVAVLGADRMKPPPVAMVDLSGQMDDLGLLGLSPSTSPGEVAAELRVASLFVIAPPDPYSSLGEMRSIYRRSPAAVKRMIVQPTAAGHGWDMLTGTTSTWSPLASQVAAFIALAGR